MRFALFIGAWVVGLMGAAALWGWWLARRAPPPSSDLADLRDDDYFDHVVLTQNRTPTTEEMNRHRETRRSERP